MSVFAAIGVLASGLYLYKELNIGDKLKSMSDNTKGAEKSQKQSENSKDEIWGQDYNIDTLPNKLELERETFNEPEEVKKQLRDLSYEKSGGGGKVNFKDAGIYFSSNEKKGLYTLEDTPINPAGLLERRPYDEIDPKTNLPTNYIKEDLHTKYDVGDGEFAEQELLFDPKDTYNNAPLLHPDQFNQLLTI